MRWGCFSERNVRFGGVEDGAIQRLHSSIRTVGLRASDYNRHSMTEWTAHCAPNGQPYFYNATTGESSWAPPVVQTQKLKRSSSFDRDNFSTNASALKLQEKLKEAEDTCRNVRTPKTAGGSRRRRVGCEIEAGHPDDTSSAADTTERDCPTSPTPHSEPTPVAFAKHKPASVPRHKRALAMAAEPSLAMAAVISADRIAQQNKSAEQIIELAAEKVADGKIAMPEEQNALATALAKAEERYGDRSSKEEPQTSCDHKQIAAAVPPPTPANRHSRPTPSWPSSPNSIAAALPLGNQTSLAPAPSKPVLQPAASSSSSNGRPRSAPQCGYHARPASPLMMQPARSSSSSTPQLTSFTPLAPHPLPVRPRVSSSSSSRPHTAPAASTRRPRRSAGVVVLNKQSSNGNLPRIPEAHPDEETATSSSSVVESSNNNNKDKDCSPHREHPDAHHLTFTPLAPHPL